MSEIDILITTHGASILNGIFMKANSVVINILNSPFIEYVFSPMLREAGVHILYVPVLNPQLQCSGINCPYPLIINTNHSSGHSSDSYNKHSLNSSTKYMSKVDIPYHCIADNDNIHRGHIECIALRQCSVQVDRHLFKHSLYEAYYYISHMKWFLQS